ncbi:MAG: D-amino acid dehydrogenase [Rhodospirillales bacterium]|nr:D-amino acid dehydrogenase [Rhodospirillales bacterium]
MKIIVLGAGVIGVTTAYFLNKEGHEVTLIDRQPGVGLETSFANGGQVSVSHAEPWANPSVIGKALHWLGKENAPLLFRARLDPTLWAWTLRFLRNCTAGRAKINTERTLRVAEYSRTVLQKVRHETGINYDQKTKGILHVYRSSKEYESALSSAEIMKNFGFDRRPFTPQECVDLDPAFAASQKQLVGALYSPEDESGDAHIFTKSLAEKCSDKGVNFNLGTLIQQLEFSDGKITAVITDKGRFEADKFVVCMGSYSPLLVKPLGLKLPIYPAKGYSVTIPVSSHKGAPEVSLTDDEYKLVYSRLGERLRVAGTAEFAGYNTEINNNRARNILELAMGMFPDCGEADKAEFWAGLRPKTPDSVPIIAGPIFKNLYLNTGHGTLGWTMSCGSGQILADLINNKKPEISLEGLGLDRF